MTNDELQAWFDDRLEMLKESIDPKDIRLMMDLLRVRSQLKLDSAVAKNLDLENMSEAELLKKLREIGD